MLNWFNRALSIKKTESHDEMANRIRPMISRILPLYGEIIENWPLVIFPISKLPLPKQEMKVALQLAWYRADAANARASLAHAYTHLCHFREDVRAPIDPTLPADATPYEAKQILDPYLAIEDRIEAERRALAVEFTTFESLATGLMKRT
jgi:hypothetical protein